MKDFFTFLLIVFLAACVPAPTQTSEVVATANVTVILEVTVTPTPIATPAKETPPAVGTVDPRPTGEGSDSNLPGGTPESVLPADFTVANWTEFRTKILQYCYVRPDLSSNEEGLNKLKNEVEGLEFYRELLERKRMGEIFTIGRAVFPATEGGCGIVGIMSDMSTMSGAFFQSRLDPTEWIEVRFTDPSGY